MDAESITLVLNAWILAFRKLFEDIGIRFRMYGNPGSSSPCFLFLTFNLGVSEVR